MPVCHLGVSSFDKCNLAHTHTHTHAHTHTRTHTHTHPHPEVYFLALGEKRP